ncbi:Multiple sugar-binding protein precursor [Rhodobacteraceae bacterium THAF1]|uniref:ABC transporter substrate-binding protein n=1 Tax=Palleronia sp. THAF1 TaxID=2587842 RepID=UPI000F3FEAB1|nr:ABC transporter substrate-binding protein [Palleronia sp. THAF1]QFU08528.1 Multiple sugar-binding protein precursor [Palleronia sp. THAF1]VDC30575.1 Multiple sugar-binding protein precursor [Rhodobacteraceae bacterium THAF1]
MLRHTKLSASVAALSLFATGALAQDSDLSGTLRIISDMSNPAPRAVMEGMAAEFDEMHPDLTVELEVVDREAWKSQIRNALSANPPDVVNWYASNRMGPYVDAGLFMDITDWWDAGDYEGLESVKGALTLNDAQWGVPYTYYQWGVYYREDIYNELGLSEPETFEQEVENCQAILDSGKKCYAIGTKFLWTAGGWFDYLNMRTNGFEHHMQLARGELSWTEDEGVAKTFENWQTLIEMGAFIDDHQSYSWQEALTEMINGDAAAYLIGNFAVPHLREAGLTDEQIDFYQFPAMTDAPLGEDAPTDTFHVAAGAQNVDAARAFLAYVTSADVQTRINGPDALGQLPVNANSEVADDEFLQQGFTMLSENAQGGIAQFFDRDFPAEMASVGMEGLQEFMVFPENLPDILPRLEDARQRIYE